MPAPTGRAAEQIRHFQLMTNPNIMPLYPLLIAVVGDGWGQKLADVAFSLASVWLVHAIALRIYRDEAIALFAALFCALWPHFVFFAAVGPDRDAVYRARPGGFSLSL